MKDLLVIVPTRGRPQNAKRLVDAWEHSAGRARLALAVDLDDPELLTYESLAGQLTSMDGMLLVAPRMRLGGTLNAVATAKAPEYAAVGFMGDDHLPRTPRWDRAVMEELEQLGTGIVYGNDLLQGERLPTAVFMTSDIVKTLGYMVPPDMVHLYLDDFWLRLGRELGRIKYLPRVIIEHVHPAAGKASWDDRYEEVNADGVLSADRLRFEEYCANDLAEDLKKLRAIL